MERKNGKTALRRAIKNS